MENFVYRIVWKLAVLGVIFLWAAGYFSSTSGVYDVSVAEAHATLARTPVPPVVFGSDVGSAPAFVTATRMKVELLPAPGEEEDQEERNFSINSSDPRRIVWTLKRGGRPVLNLVAILEPAANNWTRIAVDIGPAGSDPGGKIANKLADNKTIKNLYVTAMREQIAAVLERRTFDMTSVYPAMMAAATANAGPLRKNMYRAIEADQKRTHDNIEKAYEREAAGEER